MVSLVVALLMFVLLFIFSLEYRNMGFWQKLPPGIYSPAATYHNSLHFESKSRMHQTLIKSYGYEFLDANAISHIHTDYRLEICSKMFLPSLRDRGRKYYF